MIFLLLFPVQHKDTLQASTCLDTNILYHQQIPLHWHIGNTSDFGLRSKSLYLSKHQGRQHQIRQKIGHYILIRNTM
ncbi:MAG: hypothetical protein C7K11_07505 [Candidatus Amulumruptor caecigallinarius]|nr:MAG: hypothetical protein C7K11_07505 [Candidatus Amulumruptor caecigallinarius]